MGDAKIPHRIQSDKDVDYLIAFIKSNKHVADRFVFDNDALAQRFFSFIGIDMDRFAEKYYYYDEENSLHIAESEDGFFWISNIGLVAQGRLTTDKYVNACASQYWVMKTLLSEAEKIYSNPQVFDVDSYCNGELKSISIALSSNLVFYTEVFYKAYLSVSQKTVSRTHHLVQLLSDVESTMFQMDHNNTLFHALVLPFFRGVADQIAQMPADYREAFMKYDDNNDQSVLLLDKEMIKNWKNEIETSIDFVLGYYYERQDCLYLKPGLYERILSRASSVDEAERLKNEYHYLIEKED